MDTIYSKRLRALDFAATAHTHQRRKNAVATPYINHLIAVANLMASCGVMQEDALIAALLHDVEEDCGVTRLQLQESFGTDVEALVFAVTDDKSLAAPDRKRLQIEHAPHLSIAAKWIKVADKTCNIADIGSEQMPDWSLARKVAYVDWARRVVEAAMRGYGGGEDSGQLGRLRSKFNDAYDAAMLRLGTEPETTRDGAFLS